MKAFQVKGPQQFGVESIAIPPLGDNEVSVKVAHAGICGSDLHIIHGQNAFVQYPRIAGHEFSGFVNQVGQKVSGLKVGDRVTVDPVINCGTCYPCSIGRPNVCVSLQVIGVHRDGGLSEYINAPAVNVYKLPDSITLSQGALIEPYTVALNVLSRMTPFEGDKLLVYGAGVIGLTIVQVAFALGLRNIAVTDVIDSRLETAKSLGASHVINSRIQDLEAFIMEWTDDVGVPLIADAACIPELLPEMLRFACPAGRIGLLGFSATPSDLAQLEVIRKELSLVGSRLNNKKFPDVIKMLESGRLDTSSLISHRVKIDDMPDVIQLIEQQPQNVRKVLVGFDVETVA